MVRRRRESRTLDMSSIKQPVSSSTLRVTRTYPLTPPRMDLKTQETGMLIRIRITTEFRTRTTPTLMGTEHPTNEIRTRRIRILGEPKAMNRSLRTRQKNRATGAMATVVRKEKDTSKETVLSETCGGAK